MNFYVVGVPAEKEEGEVEDGCDSRSVRIYSKSQCRSFSPVRDSITIALYNVIIRCTEKKKKK